MRDERMANCLVRLRLSGNAHLWLPVEGGG